MISFQVLPLMEQEAPLTGSAERYRCSHYQGHEGSQSEGRLEMHDSDTGGKEEKLTLLRKAM